MASLLLASETFHLALRNAFFVQHAGYQLALAAAWYLGFAIIVALPTAIIMRDSRWQLLALAVSYYVLISLRMFLFDAPLLRVPVLAAGFVVASTALFAGCIFTMRRQAPLLTPLFLLVAYVNVCAVIAAGWALGGGRLTEFLVSARTLKVVLAGTIGLLGCLWVQRHLEKRGGWRPLLLPSSVLVMLVLLILAVSRFSAARPEPPRATAAADIPDVYVLSFDALRSDALRTLTERHPSGSVARLVSDAASFGNVVSHGVSTYDILSNNTYGSRDKSGCRSSLPGTLRAQGYFTAMIFGRIGRRFNGAECYDSFYAGGNHTLVAQLALPRLLREAFGQDGGMRDVFLAADDLLVQLGETAQRSEPIFAYVHFLELHAPYIPTRRVGDSEHAAGMKRFMTRCYDSGCEPQDPDNAALIQLARAAYTESLDDVERTVERALHVASTRGRPFVVILTADHGELLGEHDGFAHSGGFVSELLDIPFVVYDSRVKRFERRCELMLSSEAVRVAATTAAMPELASYPDHPILRFESPPLGRAMITKANELLEFELSKEVLPHAGTWRNIHKAPAGEVAYPIDKCE